METKPNSLIHSFDGTEAKNYGGLTKREYFAAMAMQGLLSSESGWKEPFDRIAAMAVSQGDLLIIELNKPTKELG
jgi:hypothetical protein